ncbi:hypothetical protein MMC17_003689 [Xylographa soralifera]|nr:hypothetical protein [Xylographa soralifera]
MSSRALRKLQREEDEKKRLSELQKNEDGVEEDESDDNLEEQPRGAPKPNVFDMLNAYTDEEGGGTDPEEVEASHQTNEARTIDADEAHEQDFASSSKAKAQNHPQSRKKKKSKKKKEREATEDSVKLQTPNDQANLDDIDLALLSIKGKTSISKEVDNETLRPSEELKRLYQLLATDTKYLNALNEMKRLFGNVVLEDEDVEAGVPAQGRRRERGRRQLDLGGALAARNSPVSRGQGLVGLALRRNVFMIGKESWPKATSGGLGMIVMDKPWDLTTEYAFVHNSVYQDVQKQFHTCVESMDPQRMIQLLQYNPYHISTLLVVSEIAEQQGDHSVAGELLERALFSFGRSVHSSFHATMSEGKARLDFRRPENREFWLVAWRYIKNLGQRGTWRTAYEWAKLILSLDPEEDPYGIHLILDQLAIRSAQFQSLVDLTQTLQSLFITSQRCPNLEISLALAEYKLKQSEACRITLKSAVKNYPWVFARLFRELNIGHIPKSIWGSEAKAPRDKLECEAYVSRAKDLWNTPEAISLLVEVVESADAKPYPIIMNNEIMMNEARHILLSEMPSLIALLPREFTTAPSSSYDVLPPEDGVMSYNTTTAPDSDEGEIDLTANRSADAPSWSANQQVDEVRELRGLEAFFNRIIPWLGSSTNRNTSSPSEGQEHTEEEIQELVERSGVPPEVIAQRTARMLELHNRHNEEDGEDREDEEDEEEYISPEHRALEEAQVAALFRSGGSIETLMGLDEQQLNNLFSTIGNSNNQAPDPTAQSESTHTEQENTPEPYDDQRNQRWLAGQGMLRLKDFVTEHGTDEKVWTENGNIDSSPVTEYAERVALLEKRASKNFILDYVLRQGTSSDVRALILRTVEHMEK